MCNSVENLIKECFMELQNHCWIKYFNREAKM